MELAQTQSLPRDEHARSHGAEHLVDVEASPDGEPHSSGIYRGDRCEVRRGVWATDLSPRQDVMCVRLSCSSWTTQLRLRLSVRSDVGHGTTLAHEDGVVGLPLRMYFLTSDGDAFRRCTRRVLLHPR